MSLSLSTWWLLELPFEERQFSAVPVAASPQSYDRKAFSASRTTSSVLFPSPTPLSRIGISTLTVIPIDIDSSIILCKVQLLSPAAASPRSLSQSLSSVYLATSSTLFPLSIPLPPISVLLPTITIIGVITGIVHHINFDIVHDNNYEYRLSLAPSISPSQSIPLPLSLSYGYRWLHLTCRCKSSKLLSTAFFSLSSSLLAFNPSRAHLSAALCFSSACPSALCTSSSHRSTSACRWTNVGQASSIKYQYIKISSVKISNIVSTSSRSEPC